MMGMDRVHLPTFALSVAATVVGLFVFFFIFKRSA